MYLIHVEAARLGVAAWFEYVLTTLNDSDGLSREGWEAAVEAMQVDLFRGAPPPLPALDTSYTPPGEEVQSPAVLRIA